MESAKWNLEGKTKKFHTPFQEQLTPRWRFGGVPHTFPYHVEQLGVVASVGGNLLSAFSPILSRLSLGRPVLSSRDFTTEEHNSYTPQEVTEVSVAFPSLDA